MSPLASPDTLQLAFARWYESWADLARNRESFLASHMILAVSHTRRHKPDGKTPSEKLTTAVLRAEGTRLLSEVTALRPGDTADKTYLETCLRQSMAYLNATDDDTNLTSLRERLFYLNDTPTLSELQTLRERLTESLKRCGFSGQDTAASIAAAKSARPCTFIDIRQRSVELVENYLADFLRNELDVALPNHIFETSGSFESPFRMFVRHVESESPAIFANQRMLAQSIGFDFESVFTHEFCGHALHFSTLRACATTPLARKLVIPHTDSLYHVEAIAQAIANRASVVFEDQLPYMKLATDAANYRLALSSYLLAHLASGELTTDEAARIQVERLGGEPETVKTDFSKFSNQRGWSDANTSMAYFASLRLIWKVFPPDKPLRRELLVPLLETMMTYEELRTWTSTHG